MGKPQIRFRYEFSGSSESFVSQVAGHNHERQHRGEKGWFLVDRDEEGFAEIWFGDKGNLAPVFITVRGHPGGRSEVLGSADDQAWDLQEGNWYEFKTDTEKHGWKFSNVGDEDLNLGRSEKPGRPRLEANEWAYEQVNHLKRPARDVYPEWVEMRGPEEIANLDNPWDSFKHAIKPN